ncbi:MAG TPA: hypothetical protein ENN45_04885 [Bacteroidetes bacterium]|nr:hypothetical protein [Bacteroidota bacterium]
MMYTRALVVAAKTEQIPTFYVQHASVTAKFPELIFDYALLEGRDALLKYDRGYPISNTKVFLIGMPKADQYFPYINTSSTVERIGICTNPQDTVSKVEDLLKYLSQNYADTPLILRPHPGEIKIRSGIWSEMASRYKTEFSDAHQELIFDFLRKVDAIIAANSSVLLEAALLNIVPFYYDLSEGDNPDYYGYVQSGLAQYIKQLENLNVHLLANHKMKSEIRQRAKHYCATVNTSHDGHSCELASSIIEQVAQKRQVDLENWRVIHEAALIAYEPM